MNVQRCKSFSTLWTPAKDFWALKFVGNIALLHPSLVRKKILYKNIWATRVQIVWCPVAFELTP